MTHLVNRRNFIKTSAAALAAAAMLPAPAAAEVRNGMPYRTLGKTGEKVSLLCIGGSHIGQEMLSDDEAVRLMRTAVDEGVNFFDNAYHYYNGRSEERMGAAMRDGYRDKIFLMTKHKGLNAKTAQAELEGSLRRMQTDVIDLWQFHEIVHPVQAGRIHDGDAIEYALKARDEGKIRYIGFTGHHIPAFLVDMMERGFPWDAVQMPINIFDAHFESFLDEALPMAVEKEIGVLAMKTLGGSPGNIPNRSGACSVAECLRFAMQQPVATVVSGIDSMERLEENLRITKEYKPFTPEELADVLARAREDALKGQYEPYKTAWHRGIREEMRRQAEAEAGA